MRSRAVASDADDQAPGASQATDAHDGIANAEHHGVVGGLKGRQEAENAEAREH